MVTPLQDKKAPDIRIITPQKNF